MQDKKLQGVLTIIIILIITNFGNNKLYGEEFLLKEIKIRGVSKELTSYTNQISQKYLNKPLDNELLQQLIAELTNKFVDLGFITSRVYLPEQDISDGLLQIEVIEGFIEDLEVSGDLQHLPPNMPIKKSRKLSLQDIEQATDHYNKFRYSKLQISIEPGKEVGASRLILHNTQDRKWGVAIGVDNTGSKAKGTSQLFQNVRFESVFGLNELYVFGYRTSLADRGQKFSDSESHLFSIPFGYYDFTVSIGRNKSRYFSQGEGNIICNRSNNITRKFDISRVLRRTGSGKILGSIGFGADDYENEVQMTRPDISNYRIRKFDISINMQQQVGDGVIAGGLTYTRGVNRMRRSNFGNMRVPEKDFNKLAANFSWGKPLPAKFAGKGASLEYNLQADCMYSSNMLAAGERFTIGGESSVRGFKEESESADQAFVIRNEITTYLPEFTSKGLSRLMGRFSLFAGYDIGWFKTYQEQGKSSGYLSGGALGVRSSLGLFNVSFTVAKRDHAPFSGAGRQVYYFSTSLNL